MVTLNITGQNFNKLMHFKKKNPDEKGNKPIDENLPFPIHKL
jgi:hypothetical protein